MAPKYRVLLVHNYYRIPGGEDVVVANEKALLEQHGHTVITYFRRNEEIGSLGFLSKCLLPLSSLFSLKTYREIRRLIHAERIDVVHVHNTLTLVTPAVYYAAARCGVPVVQTIHNFRFLCPAGTLYRQGHLCEDCYTKGLNCAVRHACYRGSRLQSLIAAAVLWVHRRTGIYRKLHYLCLTEFNKKKLLQLNEKETLILPKHTFVKPNFLTEAVAPPLPFEQRENMMIFAARLEETKGVRILLEAWKLLGENAPRLLLCGEGTLKSWCEDYIREHALRRVEMRGLVPHNQLLPLIAQARALILPSQWYEGFPMNIPEAHAAGTPVIGSDLGNVGDLVRAGGGLTFRPDSAEELAAAVRRAATEPISLHPIRGTEAEENYARLMQIYNTICGR